MIKFIRSHLIDFIITGSILLGSVLAVILFNVNAKNNNFISKIYVKNNLVMTIDLTKETDERNFVINGSKTEMTIAVRHNAIRVLKSGCPHQDCVDMGWVTKANKPIICVYNEMYINFDSVSDVVVG